MNRDGPRFLCPAESPVFSLGLSVAFLVLVLNRRCEELCVFRLGLSVAFLLSLL